MTSKKPAFPERVLPPHAPGMRIGLFGGTFDPPHEAHLAASLLAFKRLKLDRVWWLVTPGNPLKNTSGLGPLRARIAAARALTDHPRIDVTGLEAVIKTRYTYDTIKWLVARCPGVHFVWIMGADNLRSFHRWQKWRGIAKLVPVRGGRPPRAEPLCRRQPGGTGLGPRPHPRSRRRLLCLSASRRPGSFSRSQIAFVVDGVTRLAAARRNNRQRDAFKQTGCGKKKAKSRRSPSRRANRSEQQRTGENTSRISARVERSGRSLYLEEEPRIEPGRVQRTERIKPSDYTCTLSGTVASHARTRLPAP